MSNISSGKFTKLDIIGLLNYINYLNNKGMRGKLSSTKLFIFSIHTFWCQSQLCTTFLAKAINLLFIQLVSNNQLSQKLKFWRKKFPLQSYSAHQNSPYSFIGFILALRPSDQQLVFWPNYQVYTDVTQLTQLYQLSWKLKVWHESCPL